MSKGRMKRSGYGSSENSSQGLIFSFLLITVILFFYHRLNKNSKIFCLQASEQEPPKDAFDQMVWTPENLARDASLRISMYRDTMLRLLEVSWLGLHNVNQV